MQVGDLIRLSDGTKYHFDIDSNTGILWKKIPRADHLAYDWEVFVAGRFIKLGRQIEYGEKNLINARS